MLSANGSYFSKGTEFGSQWLTFDHLEHTASSDLECHKPKDLYNIFSLQSIRVQIALIYVDSFSLFHFYFLFYIFVNCLQSFYSIRDDRGRRWKKLRWEPRIFIGVTLTPPTHTHTSKELLRIGSFWPSSQMTNPPSPSTMIHLVGFVRLWVKY